jgi:uncharacterized protein (DUF58 family)
LKSKNDSLPIILIILLILGIIFNEQWVVLFSIAILIVQYSAIVWKDYSLQGVNYRRKWHYQKGFPGEKTHFSVEVENRKKIPISWLHSIDPWPAQVDLDEKNHLINLHSIETSRFVNFFSMRPWEKITRKFNITFQKRGVFPVGPLRLESGDIFGYYRKSKEETSWDYLTVYPVILQDLNLEIPAEDPVGIRQTSHSLFQDINQPIGVRPYQREDSFRTIHWNATARTGELQSKIFQPVLSKVMVIVLNISTTAQPWLGTSHELIERLIQVAATLAYQNFQKGYSVGIISNGCLAHADHPFMIMPGKSREHLALILESLAAVTPYITTPFEEYFSRSIPQIPYGSTIVIETGLVTPLLLETIIRLKSHRNQIALISLELEKPPAIPGVYTLHLPFQEDRLFDKK